MLRVEVSEIVPVPLAAKSVSASESVMPTVVLDDVASSFFVVATLTGELNVMPPADVSVKS